MKKKERNNMAVVDNFLVFKKAVQDKLKEMEKTGKEFYETNTETDVMWNTYLETIPKKINPIFRQRRVYDCCCCRHFIKQVGNIVIINDDNTLTSIWDVEIGDEGFDTVAKKLSEYVKSRPILDVFRTKFNKFGQEYNWDNVDDIKWEHFVYDVPSRFISRDVSSDVAVFRDNRFVFNRSLAEITDEAYSTVLDLINDNILYRGEEYKNAVSKMYKFKKEYDKLADSEKMAYSWRVSVGLPSSVCKIRNTAIGTLLIDLSEGVDVETAVKKYENVVAPANYKRPKAIFTQKMLEDAKNTVMELGYLDSLKRRFANLNDISVANTLFADRTVKNKDFDSFFDMMTDDVLVNPKKVNAKDITLDEFVNDVLPSTTSLSVLFENKHSKNLVSLIAPSEIDSKSMFKWNNGFSWAYTGNMTDSFMKQRVKEEGGKIDGDLRFSIMWNDGEQNFSDLDAHCLMANKEEIFYGHKRANDGNCSLDVDIIDPIRGKAAVENIVFVDRNRMRDGEYRFFVNYYTSRTGHRNGFKAEIEFDGNIYEFSYSGDHGNNVLVAKITVKNGEFELMPYLETQSNVTSTNHWGVGSNKFVPVSLVCYSPNYWDDNKVGNRHVFFMLKDCINDEEPNAFYNEFLKDELVSKHKRVFEALGSKAHVESTDSQLSGIGFSTTQRNTVIVKADKNVYKVNF